jgi:hypothetical protein
MFGRRGRTMGESKTVVRLWAFLAFAVAWNMPLVVRLFVRYPMWSALPFVAWGLAVAIALAWLVPAFRRAVFVPDAAARGGAEHSLASALGMVFAGVALYVVQLFDPDI